MADNRHFDLDTFVRAQERVWPSVLEELRAGRKTGHWMWFVFPQLRGLGASAMALRFALTSLDEARAYAAHPVLGQRLREAAQALLQHAGQDIGDILGYPDDLKLRSCMTLFEWAVPGDPIFPGVLDAFYGGQRDPLTCRLLAAP